MAINRLMISEAVHSIGMPGVVGIALLVFSLSFALSTLLPSWRQLAQLRAAALAQVPARDAVARGSMPETSPAAELQRFYDLFPPRSDAPQWLSRMYAVAAEKRLPLLRGEYLLSTDPQTGLVRYRIVLPVRGSYAQVRTFVAATLRAVPAMALDEVSFERPKISEPEVEARIRLTLYLKRPA